MMLKWMKDGRHLGIGVKLTIGFHRVLVGIARMLNDALGTNNP